jgi:S-adenosylmethionine synthetase
VHMAAVPFSGMDPTKVDRSSAYLGRQMAKSIVKSGLSQRALVQLSYAMGVAKPLSLFVETYDSECSELIAEDTTNVVNIECRPGGIARSSALREPAYLRQPSTATLDAPHTRETVS